MFYLTSRLNKANNLDLSPHLVLEEYNPRKSATMTQNGLRNIVEIRPSVRR